MKLLKSYLCFASLLVFCNTLNAQRLPEGAYHSNRERSYDIIHYLAELSFNFDKRQVSGKATITVTPLRKIEVLTLDAILLNIKSVYMEDNNVKMQFRQSDNSLTITLPTRKTNRDTFSLVIDYSCQPRAGMYFVRNPDNPKLFYVSTYGEDGLHANWLPIYNDVNDKFSTEMKVTVPAPYVVISNGKLIQETQAENGEKTYHWKQTLPHPNYLISIYVGDYEKGDLPPAFGTIPLSYWVPRGRLTEGAYAFRNTTRMVEYFSNRFYYKYPWIKYDQIAVPDYAIGAMEHTGVTGHRASILRTENAPLDFNPTLNHYASSWSAEALISHELAHHWFGNTLTCRNLSYLWLNESFASYLMMLWDEESVSKDQLLFDVQLAKDQYFNYVRNQHIIRPLEYHNFDDANTIYNTEHTYLKGAAVLHMLRKLLGDEPYFQALGYYLKKHEFSNVVSDDLKIAIEESTGENLYWFFEQWVTGGGHPQFEVKYEYLAKRKIITLSVSQVQPLVKGQGIFKLPVKIKIVTPDKTWLEKIWLEKATQRFRIACDQQPLMVSFDGDGDLVAEVSFPKDVDELAYQARHDAVPGRLWAIRQLASHYPVEKKTIETFGSIIASEGFWGTRAEVALQLGTIRTNAAEILIAEALHAPDYRIRKAGVLALEKFGPGSAAEKLEQIINKDSHVDVVATALLTLAKINPELDPAFIKKQLTRKSWYDEIIYAAMLACKELKNKALLPTIKRYATHQNNQFVHGAALEAWAACLPNDKQLHSNLISLTESPVYTLQQSAISILGTLHVGEAKERLQRIVEENADANLVVAARKALDKIEWVQGEPANQ